MERGRDGEEELEEEEEDEEEEDGGPESALEKSPFQLTAADVYDISSVVGRDLLQLRAGPQLPAARARLQFRIVRVLEMLEALVSESSVAEEQLRRERDSLRRELEQLRAAARGSAPQPSLGPDQMVIDLTDPNRPRFTLQELRDVLQERNQLKAQLLVVQEELQCYKSGIISQKRDQTEELAKEASGSSAGTSKDSEEKTIIKRLNVPNIHEMPRARLSCETVGPDLQDQAIRNLLSSLHELHRYSLKLHMKMTPIFGTTMLYFKHSQ
ncbi:hypothetical protein DUI87_17285 [Hirundo rustica rustica]|uniref:RILP-like protein 2 n=1 Tax=Hirundo rustica rustica TaxID=333673 RepID=A0A3M0JXG5_HIRRU|nr:hypothetical protein DUI87_17285 [Hirundo rustica rustica]